MFPNRSQFSDTQLAKFEQELESLAHNLERMLSEVERNYHHCEPMPENWNLLRGRHPQMHNGKWSEWQWEIDKHPRDGSVFFCIYCMEDLPTP